MMHCMMPLFIREIVEIELIVAFQASLCHHFTVDLLEYKRICYGMFTYLHKRKAHYSRVSITIVPQ